MWYFLCLFYKVELLTWQRLDSTLSFSLEANNGEFSRREIMIQRSNNFVPDLNQKDDIEVAMFYVLFPTLVLIYFGE